MILADLFEASHTRGDLKLLPRIIGGYVLFDTSAPLNRGALSQFSSLPAAHAALEAEAARRGIP
jgi:hypothetical protein